MLRADANILLVIQCLLSDLPIPVTIRYVYAHQYTKEHKAGDNQPGPGVGLVIDPKEVRRATDNLHVAVTDQQLEILGSPTGSNDGLSVALTSSLLAKYV